MRLFLRAQIRLVWNYDPISRGLKHLFLRHKGRGFDDVWNYDPISRGLKHKVAGMDRPPFAGSLEL